MRIHENQGNWTRPAQTACDLLHRRRT